MLSRRLVLRGAASVALLHAQAGPALAQSYPARPITLIVPFAAGGFNDVIVRIVTAPMSKTLGVSIIVENDAGAGGTTATARGAAAPADGYTLIAGSMGTHGAAPSQYPNLKYDPARDFTPIGLTAEAPAVLVTRKDFPLNTLKSS
jgi:tripartite-type tricarboxylate transporter receptor subunit TctC